MLSLAIGCASGTQIKEDEFKFIHFNNPECAGMSGSGIIMSRVKTGEIVKAEIAQKSGYCETIGGQAITTGADIGSSYLLKKGLEDSGTTTQNSISGGGGVAPPPAPPQQDN